MRYFKYGFITLVLAALVATMVTCKHQVSQKPQPHRPQPQKPQQSTEPPLLLEDNSGLENLPPPEGPVADNSRCHVCHINYEQEELAVLHARVNIGCEQCHGASDAHCSDEDNITPPDIMYPAAKINLSCLECHPKNKIDIQPHEFLFAATEKKYCTDCHGEHRLAYRTRKWDRETGELLQDDSVRMTTEQMLEQK